MESSGSQKRACLCMLCVWLAAGGGHGTSQPSGTVDPRLSESRLSDTSIIRIRKLESHNRNYFIFE